MKLPKYLLCYNRTELAGPVILSTTTPYYVGNVWRFKDSYEFIEKFNAFKGLGKAVIPGYNIMITLATTIQGPKFAVTNPNVAADIQIVLDEMAEFFKEEQIDDKPGYYRRFKS